MLNNCCQMLYGKYRNKKFTDIFPDYTTFNTFITNSEWANVLSAEGTKSLYYMLYAQYGNSPIANADENQFKYKVLYIIFSYGPSWEKKLDIQKALRNLTEEEILLGSKAIYNHAFNPSTPPSTDTLDELETINEQSTQKFKKSKIEAYGTLYALIVTNVTTEFINKFKPLFLQVVAPEMALLYEEDKEND